MLACALLRAGRTGAGVGAALAAPPPYVTRGDAVEARFRECKDRLERARAELGDRIAKDAPDLSASARHMPAPDVPRGYQVVPKIIPDPPPPAMPQRSHPAIYSWPWTDQMITRQADAVARFEHDLEQAGASSPGDRHAAYRTLLDRYRDLAGEQRTIDAHIHYNRQWQAEIAGDRAAYDRQTSLLRATLQRQAIRDALAAADGAAFRQAVAAITGIDPSQDRPVVEVALRDREATLSRTIHDATDEITTPRFVRVEQSAPRRWVVRVPVYSDVEDRELLRAFATAVESVWALRDADAEFRLALDVIPIAPARLYGLRPPPARGTAIDLHAHLALFPPDGAVLTTGGAVTNVTDGRAIVLGPHDVARHVLAHEFGHVLGFRDVYFRGYRDLGPDGYEVTEVVADPDDIMGAPGSGPVRRHHFEKLIQR